MNSTAIQAIPMAQQVVGMLLSGEQTEAYIFAAAAERGYDASAVNRAIGALVGAGVVRETVIDGRDIVGGVVVRGARCSGGRARARGGALVSLSGQDMGNGESVVAGLVVEQDGTLLAITPSASKPFKTHAGAALWLARRGYNVDGTRRSIPEAERVYPVRRRDGAVVLCSVPGRVSL